MDDENQATYEELAQIEREFDDIDVQIIAQQYILSAQLYAKRAQLVQKIKQFWPLALEQAPLEVDQFIQPSDSEVFAACLKDISLTRFEIPEGAKANAPLSELGNPRSIHLRFEFEENEWFEDRVLEKKLWFRRSKTGETGLVSEPVKIHWKPAKDLSDGLTDAAFDLFQKVMKAGKGGAKQRFEMKEYKDLAEKVENSPEGSQSFFTFFAYKGGWLTAEESDEANREEEQRKEAAKRGEKVAELPEPDEDELPLDGDDAEVFPGGEELAIALAEDFWPNALKYFTTAQEDDGLSDMDFEDMDEDDDDEADGEEPELLDIRSLVKDSQKSNGPPSKRRKT